MRLGKNQIREVAQMIKALFTHVNYIVDSDRPEGFAIMVQVQPDDFMPRDGMTAEEENSLSNRRREFYANLAKRGIVTGSDESWDYTYIGSPRGTVTYHTYYYLSPAQLGQYLADPKVLEAIAELREIGTRHSTFLNPAGFLLVSDYINGTGEIPWLNGHDYWLSPENKENS